MSDWDLADKLIQTAADELSAFALPREARRDPDTPLEGVDERYLPSKRHHDYLRWYDLHFAPHRETAKKVVEIGVETDRSIKMWEEYFPNAEIIGVDIAEHCKQFEGGRRRIFVGDQHDPNFLKRLISETGGDFDIIIDDGLHTPRAMMMSFVNLFPALKRGGLYVVEDIISQPDTIEFFNSLARRVNHWPKDHSTRDWVWMPPFDDQSWLTQNVVGVSIYRYIAFVTRGANPEDNPHLLTEQDYTERKADLRRRVNETIDAMMDEGVAIEAIEVSRRLGNRGLSTINEELERRGLL